jgi:MFS family permease
VRAQLGREPVILTIGAGRAAPLKESRMFAQALARRLSRTGIHYGWAIVAIVFVLALTTQGCMGISGALIAPLTKEFGWSTEQISVALALRIVLFGLMAPFTAALIDKYGFRRVLLAAVILIEIGLLGALGMTELWQLILFWGVIIGFGTGLTAMVLVALVAARWFTARRGLAAGILSASIASGQLMFLPAAAWLADRFGWRLALAPPIVALLLVAALVILFLVDKPEDVGLKPYGDSGDTPAHIAPPAAFSRVFAVLADSVRSSAFWVLAGTFFVCGLSTNGLIQVHFISLCGDYGVPAIAAASTLAMMGVFDLAGTIGSGWLSDRFDNRALLSMYYGLRGLSLLYLPSSAFTVVGLSFFGVFYGLDWIATVPPTVKLTTTNFGRERSGVVYGWIYASHMIGAATAAWVGGFARTMFGTYLPAFYGAGIACLLAAAAIWLVGRTQSARERLVEARA